MVCNQAMNDSDLIDALGGPTKVALLLGYPPFGGTQRVCNWRQRGIPARVKLDFQHIFLQPTANTTGAPPVPADEVRDAA
jgi:hypothetical protein